MTDVTIRQMLEAGVHFGHQACNWNPKMASYIFGVRHKIHIINLEKTVLLYRDAVNFLSSIAAKKGRILFVGTKPAVRDAVRAEAERCGMPYVNHRWLGGMLTNYKTIRQSIKHFKELEELRDSPLFGSYTKKEALTLTRKIAKMEKSLGGIKNMNGLPEAVLVLDVGHDNIAVSEAAKLRIPLVGVVDTNNNPDGIDYVIPGNDDSLRAVKLYLREIVDAIIAARGNIVEEEAISKEREDKKTGKKLVAAKPKKKVITRKAASATEVTGEAVTEASAENVAPAAEATATIAATVAGENSEEEKTKQKVKTVKTLSKKNKETV